jgi:hypothetical protein
MLSIENQIQSLFSPRVNPPILSVTSGTKIDKFVHGFNMTSLHSKYNISVRRDYKTQLTTEKMKLDGDPSMQHFIHKVPMFVDYDENDFALMGKTIPPNLMQDLDKTWNSLDYASLESLLDLFFLPASPMYLKDALNGVIRDVVYKYKNGTFSYELSDYYKRERIGVWLQTPVESVDIYNRVCEEFLVDYLASRGFGFLPVHSAAAEKDGLAGKANLNKYFKSNFDILDNPTKYPNGIVAMSPPWGFASRSMTESRLDVSLNLRNSVNTQDDDRVMSGGVTLDGKAKLLGLNVNAGFRKQTQDWSSQQTEHIRNLYNEQLKEDPKTPQIGPWLRGVNIYQRIAGSIPQLMSEQALSDELTDSEKAFRDMLNVDLTNKHVWGRTDILLKLHIAKGNKKVESLIAKIQKRVPSSKNTAPKSKQDKSDEKKVEEFYVQILESLFGFLVRMKGFAAESNFVTVRDTLEAISLNPALNKSMIKDLGISAEEYIILLGDDENQGLPESTMNHLLNSMNAEAN